ncbi:MAG: hypothetical protein GY797_16840 [Deltaproteobacteria bacterium]|nr:hypothetical protein [Deltaproteobacteria bacterium]
MEDLITFVSAIASTGFFVFKLVLGLGLLGFIGFGYFAYGKKRWLPWQKLAKRNNLTFIPGNTFVGAQVVGNYRGRHLTLKTSKKNYGRKREIYTQIVLSSTARQRNDKSVNSVMTRDDMINLLTPNELSVGLWERLDVDPAGQEILYEKPGIETNLNHLLFLFDWVSDISDNYSAIVSLGGAAVQYLYKLAARDSRLRPLSTRLLSDIARETTSRLGKQSSKFCCSSCLARCKEHRIQLNWYKPLTYYGCRICGESREVFEEPTIIAVLDNQLEKELSYDSDALRVNWIMRRTLFDFDEVEIRQASDEEIERFAVQVGNDTDLGRKPYYKQMLCQISQICDLSENSIRILKKMFGRIEWITIEKSSRKEPYNKSMHANC